MPCPASCRRSSRATPSSSTASCCRPIPGFDVDAGPGTRVDNVTAVDVKNGVRLWRGPGNVGLQFAASAARSLVRRYSGVAYGAADAADWFFEHCAAEAPAAEALDFSPKDERVRLPVTATSGDGCVAYLGAGSALRGAAGIEGDVGANVVFRYVDGVLTEEPLWQPATGAVSVRRHRRWRQRRPEPELQRRSRAAPRGHCRLRAARAVNPMI